MHMTILSNSKLHILLEVRPQCRFYFGQHVVVEVGLQYVQARVLLEVTGLEGELCIVRHTMVL